MNKIVVIAHNVRSANNVGSLFRTAEGLGVKKLYLSGYTPYPAMPTDERLPHTASKVSKQINKTALGAEESLAWGHIKDTASLIKIGNVRIVSGMSFTIKKQFVTQTHVVGCVFNQQRIFICAFVLIVRVTQFVPVAGGK